MRASQQSLDLLRAYYSALDRRRFDEAATHLHEACRIRFPNGVTVAGRDRIVAIARRSLTSLAGTEHVIQNAWEENGELIFELEVTYRRTDGETLRRPGVGIFELEHGRIRGQRLFVDNSGIWDRG